MLKEAEKVANRGRAPIPAGTKGKPRRRELAEEGTGEEEKVVGEATTQEKGKMGKEEGKAKVSEAKAMEKEYTLTNKCLQHRVNFFPDYAVNVETTSEPHSTYCASPQIIPSSPPSPTHKGYGKSPGHKRVATQMATFMKSFGVSQLNTSTVSYTHLTLPTIYSV